MNSNLVAGPGYPAITTLYDEPGPPMSPKSFQKRYYSYSFLYCYNIRILFWSVIKSSLLIVQISQSLVVEWKKIFSNYYAQFTNQMMTFCNLDDNCLKSFLIIFNFNCTFLLKKCNYDVYKYFKRRSRFCATLSLRLTIIYGSGGTKFWCFHVVNDLKLCRKYQVFYGSFGGFWIWNYKKFNFYLFFKEL